MGGWGDDDHAAKGHADDGLHGWEEALAASAHSHLHTGEHERLDLNEGDRLPWLEGDEDDYYEKTSFGRVILAGLAALLLVGGIVGGIWWATHRNAAEAPVADGSTVTPPTGQYKDAPADPGGKTFQGTGDTSYVVSQGQNRQAQLADGQGVGDAVVEAAASSGASGPGRAAAKTNTAAPAAEGPKVAKATGADSAPVGGVVQIGAFSSKDLAEAGWSRLSSQHPLLAQQHHRILQGQADIGTVWRLQVVTGAGGGNGLCDRLKAEGLSCQVKH